jgi:hypothetical protein
MISEVHQPYNSIVKDCIKCGRNPGKDGHSSMYGYRQEAADRGFEKDEYLRVCCRYCSYSWISRCKDFE